MVNVIKQEVRMKESLSLESLMFEQDLSLETSIDKNIITKCNYDR